jgi:secretion/DNA translocation related TadE-like protein
MSGGWDERGSGSILAVAIISAMVLLSGLLLPLIGVLQAKQSAADAADNAALAGADAAVGIIPGFPCAEAARVARADGATIGACVVDGAVVTVRTTSTVFGRAVTASATAGPPPAASN